MTDLDRALRRLGAHIEFPTEPDLAGRVLARLGGSVPPKRLRTWKALAATAALLILVVAVIPSARETVTAWLGIRGLTVTQGDPGALGSELDLGAPTTVDQALSAGGQRIRLPSQLGEPDAAYVDSEGRFWFAYRPTEGLPESGSTGLGALLTVFEADGVPGFEKLIAAPADQITLVEVNGEPALWITGEAHGVFLEGTNQGRLAANTLIWQSGLLTYRLEAELELAEALAIARST